MHRRNNMYLSRLQKFTCLLHRVGILSNEEQEVIIKGIDHLDHPFSIHKKLP